MLNNLLVWSKAQITETNITLQPVNLHQLAKENILLAASNAEQKNIRLINDIAPDAVALADKERLNFILRNLIMNAIKFTFAGGEIRIYTPAEPGNIKTIAIRIMAKAFRRATFKIIYRRTLYYPGHRPRKRYRMGLMLCKEFAESLQGHIMVKSEEGAGSTFYIKLPQPTEETVPEEIALSLV